MGCSPLLSAFKSCSAIIVLEAFGLAGLPCHGAEQLFGADACVVYVDAIANDKFKPDPDNPGFNLLGGMKDAGHMQRLGRETGAPCSACFTPWNMFRRMHALQRLLERDAAI